MSNETKEKRTKRKKEEKKSAKKPSWVDQDDYDFI